MRRVFPLLVIAVLTLPGKPKPDPGRVTARRLNRYEYNNTVRDLLAIHFLPADDFPADDSGYGFDNIADVLSLSPVLMEKYLHAAEKIARLAVNTGPPPTPVLRAYSRRDNRDQTKGPGLTIGHIFPAEGDYKILLAVYGRADPLKASLSLDSQSLETSTVEDSVDYRRPAEFQIHVSPGEHLLSAALIANGPPVADPGLDDQGKTVALRPNPYVGSMDVSGPYNASAPPPSESYYRVFRCGHAPGHHTLACARTNIADLARRAYRRPISTQELDGLTHFVELARERGDSLEHGMQIAIEAILVSPEFLFRIERDPDPGDPTASHKISPFELATRLSYFLWSSLPDDELFQLASARRLEKPAVLEAQVRRMLADSRAQALAENFAGQWLEIRNLDSLHPDPEKFPTFDNGLRQAMKQETQLFFQSILREDRPITDFIGANYTFLNERLANFYAIPGVQGDQFRRVELPPDSHRGGLLTQASILTVSSYPARTSPVIRGKWILENILNSPPPPPPPNVPNLDEKSIGTSATARQQMEQHRANPACRSCHARMDPLGFGLENYDAIGRWRTREGNFPIDATGVLPNGSAFDGAQGLRDVLIQDKDAFARCVTEKLLTYALGRGLENYDKPTIDDIVGRTAAGDYKFTRLIEEIVASPAFQMRRGESVQ